MARYSPELLAALRTRYEQTDQPMNALAADFGIGITTLQTLARKYGWSPRSQRLRQCPPAMRLLEEAAAPLQPETPTAETTPTPTLPLAGGGSALAPPDSAMPQLAPAASSLFPHARIEALILKELAAEEARRSALGARPRPAYEMERCARTLSVLTQTLERLQRLRPQSAGGVDDDPVPKDIDAFRNELARRIEGFVESRLGKERMALNAQLADLTDDEVRELIQIGRERGMRALLEPAAEQENEH